MFNTEFTFGSNTSIGQNGTAQQSTDKQIEYLKKETNKNKNVVYKKNITIKIFKSIVVIKKEIGLGDIIDFFTKYTGLKWLIIKITKGNCGCEKRRLLFNKWLTIPFLYVTIREQFFDQISYVTDPVEFYKLKNKNIDVKYPVSKNKNENNPKPSCGCGRR
jgi:hypothetical protein